MDTSELDKKIDDLISVVRAQEPNPFVSTRILQRIESEFPVSAPDPSHIWIRVLQPVALSIALVTGILIGAWTARSGQEPVNQAAAKTSQRESLKADLFIPEITNEDNVLNVNNLPR